MKLRYMVDCVLRHDENNRPWYEPVGVWVQGPGPGLDIEMFYIDSRDPAVLARKDEANWVLNRLVEADVGNLPEDFLVYHRSTQSPYQGSCGPIMEANEYMDINKDRKFADGPFQGTISDEILCDDVPVHR